MYKRGSFKNLTEKICYTKVIAILDVSFVPYSCLLIFDFFSNYHSDFNIQTYPYIYLFPCLLFPLAH